MKFVVISGINLCFNIDNVVVLFVEKKHTQSYGFAVISFRLVRHLGIFVQVSQ